MIISIDYDDTFTADIKTWRFVIALLKAADHEVICTSARHNTEKNRTQVESDFHNLDIPVLLTSGKQKRDFARSLGYEVDVWIDDIPASIPSLEDFKQWEYMVDDFDKHGEALKHLEMVVYTFQGKSALYQFGYYEVDDKVFIYVCDTYTKYIVDRANVRLATKQDLIKLNKGIE